MYTAIGIGLIALLLGGYFGGLNAALKAFSRSRLADVLEARGRAGTIDDFVDQLPKHQILAGLMRTAMNLLVLLATLYAVEASGLIPPSRDGVSGGGSPMDAQQAVTQYVIAFLIAAVAVSIFVIALPAAWARYHPEAIVARSMPLLRVLLMLLSWVASPLHLFDPMVRRMSGADPNGEDEDAVHEQLTEEVLTVVEDHEQGGEVDEQQKEMLEGIFDLGTTTAGEVMTPRPDIEAIEAGATLAEVREAVIRIGRSRIPVYQGNIDDIVGVLYVKDLMPFVGDGESFDLRKVLRPAYLVPETKSVRELLAEFKTRKVHLAIVLDEYGGTAGLVTIEDILEEIVGDIQDEYERVEDARMIRPVDEHAVEADARVHVDDFNETLSVELPEDEGYETLGGFVLAHLGRIPAVGEAFETAGMRFTIVDADRTRVKRLRVEKLAPVAAENPAEE